MHWDVMSRTTHCVETLVVVTTGTNSMVEVDSTLMTIVVVEFWERVVVSSQRPGEVDGSAFWEGVVP